MVSSLGFDALVGRSEVLEWLLESCGSAASGRGSVVLVTGEAGIGKSRLCHEVASRVGERGFEVSEARCWAHGGAPPLWPWRELLRQADPAGSPLEPGGRRVTLTGWPGLTAGFEVFEGAAERLRRAGERAPQLLLLDDLHEADEGTLLLTRFLASQLRTAPVVVLTTVRSGAIPPGSRAGFVVAELEQSSIVVDLPGLDRVALAELVTSTGRTADASTLDLLLDTTKGNPLVAQAVLRAAPEGRLDDTLAAGVTEAFHRRLGAVDPSITAILARAAVLGSTSSIDEVAAVCECPVDEVRVAAQHGIGLGVLRSASPHELTFTHDLVRDVLDATLSTAERGDVHAAVVKVLAPTHASGDAVLRAVRHALEVAGRSPDDRDAALHLGRTAAGILMARDAFSDAAALLGEVISAVEGAGGTVAAGLRTELAHAMLVAGRVGEAHRLFVAASTAAELEGDSVAFAEAAAGLGGIWINNVRSPVEQSRILRMQRAALAGLSSGHDALELRLRSRIASGAVFWEGAPVEPLLDIVAEARGFRDPEVPLEVLSNVHTALLGPEWADVRLQLADEMMLLAADAPAGIFSLMARCWRAVDLFLVGADAAERALADLRGPAEALQCVSVLYVVRLIETMLLIRAGQLDAAEQSAARAFELGQLCEDADALAYFGVELLAVRWLQGRDAEMLALFEDIAGSENVIRGDQAFNAAVAAVAARAGHLDVARRYLGRVLAGPGLVGVPRFSTWLATLAAVIEAAAALDDAATAEAAYALLEPYARLPVVPSLAVVCFGSPHLPLGVAARASGRLDLAVRHFEAAVEANIHLGNLPRAALARVELAATLHHRQQPGDADDAGRWWDDAIDAGTRLGLSELTRRWSERRASLAESSASPVAGSLPGPASFSIRRDDRRWLVSYDGERVALPDRVGLRYLAQLVGHPGQVITARELMTGEQGARREPRQPVLDRPARQSLEHRARELADAIAEARARSDTGTQAVLEEELDAIAGELQRATGLANRDRFFDDDAERARTAVRKAVVRAVNEIASALPGAGEHLRASITTGVECRYDPSTG